MDIHSILTQLGQQMNLPNLKFDDNGVCRLVFDQKLVVDIEATDNNKIVHLYAWVGELPPENREDFMATLLEANLFGKGTKGATFALDHNHQEIYLCRVVLVESISYQDFVNILESFVNHLEAWMQKIERGDIGQHARSDVDVSDDDDHHHFGDSGFIRA